jgi:hypothetical protein
MQNIRLGVWVTRYGLWPGKTTGWVEVGGLMDTFNHGSWKVGCVLAGPPPPPPGNDGHGR